MRITKTTLDKFTYSRSNNSADYRWDETMRGFGVRIYPSGRKSFVVAYRTHAGTKRFLTIGDYGVFTLAQAREIARQHLASARVGRDPQADKRARRAEMCFRELAERFLQFAEERGKKTVRHDRQRLRDHVLPAIGNMRLSEITLRQLHALQSQIVVKTSNSTANRCMALIKRILSLAVAWELLVQSPARNLKHLKEPAPRDIALTPEQCRALLAACDADTNPYVAALIKLALLTGRRIGELLAARWTQFNPARRTLEVPQTKAGEPQIVYLSPAAMAVLQGLPRIEGNQHIIAGGKTGAPLNYYRRAWLRILKRAGLDYFPPHGLRHSFASMLVADGVPLETVGALLGHKSSVTTRRYAHHRPEHLFAASGRLAEVIELDKERDKRTVAGQQ